VEQATTSERKTSQIRRAREKGKEYEKTVINHWLAYMLGLIISFSKCSPTCGTSFFTNLSNWIMYFKPMVDPSEPKKKQE
jgi:hypothetical protein